MTMTRIFSILVLIFVVSASGQGQQQTTMYYMNLPQNHLLNPALKSDNAFYLGLPGISGVNVNFNTNFIGFSDVFRHEADGESIISVLHPDFDTEGFLNKIRKVNYIATDINIQTFGLGFRAGKDLYIFFDINERIQEGVSIPGDLFKLAFKGNEAFIGSRINLTPLDVNLMYYREIAAGFSKDFTRRLRIGVRGKALMGLAAMSTDNRNTTIEVMDDYSHKMNTDISVNISGPVTVALNQNNGIDSVMFDEGRLEDPEFWLNRSNMGFGVDIGAVYRVNERLSVSSAINGFGIINWKSDVTNLKAENEFLFSGFDMTGVIDGTVEFEDMADELLDSLKNSFIVTDESAPFRTILPGVFTLGASYSLTESLTLGVVSNTLLAAGRLRSSFMLSANANFGTGFSAGISYTAVNHSYDNIGAGLAFRLGMFQIYTIADRIPIMYNKVLLPSDPGEPDINLLLPDSWNTLSFRIGMNLVLGNRVKKRSDRPMITTIIDQN
jgi:hypothetical protein